MQTAAAAYRSLLQMRRPQLLADVPTRRRLAALGAMFLAVMVWLGQDFGAREQAEGVTYWALVCSAPLASLEAQTSANCPSAEAQIPPARTRAQPRKGRLVTLQLAEASYKSSSSVGQKRAGPLARTLRAAST